eukprot:TRINITY_DN51088_c0_g1_i1.p1 TRINITY_DN51088_c0_g1~~TRINITY_DN51088_c0_g1_i1.p1  ORF type:complete len:168 (+),score=36.27 TRINITY_DN51088_c0_g1_i1:76-579(+)
MSMAADIAISRVCRRPIYAADASRSTCPIEATIAECLQELLPPPAPRGQEHGEAVVAAGVRELAKLKRMRASAADCKQCAAFKCIALCGACSNRRLQLSPPTNAALTLLAAADEDEFFCSKLSRTIEYDESRSRSMPAQPSRLKVQAPVAPKPTNLRPRSASRLCKR